MNDNAFRVELRNVQKIMKVTQMRVYDEIFKLDIEENEESLR